MRSLGDKIGKNILLKLDPRGEKNSKGSGIISAYGDPRSIYSLDASKQRRVKLYNFKKISEKVAGYVCNVVEEKSLQDVAEKIIQTYGKIDALINAAGGNKPGATVGPTQSVFDTNSTFDNYFTWTQPNGAAINLAPINPVALLDLVDDTAKINRFIANAKIDYKLPFSENVTATISTGYDKSDSEGSTITSALFPTSDTTWNGSTTKFTQEATNKLFDIHRIHSKDLVYRLAHRVPNCEMDY